MTPSLPPLPRTAGLCPALLGALLTALTPAHAEGAVAGGCACLTRTVMQQPGAALFLASYPGAEAGPLHQSAFLYDNALAAIALVACGQAVQGRRIGEAILLALAHDRHWHDGRLRNGYAAGTVAAAPLQLPGWWSAREQRWLEDNYQDGSDSGNMAWAMLALLTLDADGAGRYQRGALEIAQWLETQRDVRGAGGFNGGSFGSEEAPRPLLWKSTEHNVDLVAAFARLARASGDPHWQLQSELAQRFVSAMWDPERRAFAAGTREDGVTPNPLLALDAQIWPLLAVPGALVRYPDALTRGAQRLRIGTGYAAGYSYSEAGGGPWTEGTAMVALLQERLLPDARAAPPVAAIEAARTADGGYYATTVASLPTGFMLDTDPSQPRTYQHLEHLAAAAWVALREQGFNPFTGGRSLPKE
jgi:hypothetical protein